MAFCIVAGKAKSHREYGTKAFTVKRLRRKPQPITQPISRAIGKRLAAFMHPDPRRLARYQNLNPGRGADDWARIMYRNARRKPIFSETTLRNFGKNLRLTVA